MRIFRPFSVSILAFVLFFVYFWFSMAGMDYDGTRPFASFITGGWFILGFPFVLALAVAFGAFAAWLTRRWHRAAGWGAMAMLAALTGFVIYQSLPQNRVSSLIGADLAQGVTIHHLLVMDSMNDGTSVCGVISGPSGLFDAIIKRRSLKLKESPLPKMPIPKGSLPEWGNVRKGVSPESGDVYTNGRSAFNFDAATGRIYFRISGRTTMPNNG